VWADAARVRGEDRRAPLVLHLPRLGGLDVVVIPRPAGAPMRARHSEKRGELSHVRPAVARSGGRVPRLRPTGPDGRTFGGVRVSRPEHVTPAQQKTLSAIVGLTAAKGYPPTLRELAAVVDAGVGTVVYHLQELERKGRIERVKGLPRAIR